MVETSPLGSFQTHLKGKICYRCGKAMHQPGQACAMHLENSANSATKWDILLGFVKTPRKLQCREVLKSKTQDNSISNSPSECTGLKQTTLNMMVHQCSCGYDVKSTDGPQKYLEFPIGLDPRTPLLNKILVRLDTGADMNCMNSNTFPSAISKSKATTK